MITYPFANVRIYSQQPMEEVASIVSSALFGGLPFGGKDLSLCDEVPALRLEAPLLGLQVVIHGYPGEYTLYIRPRGDSMQGEPGSPSIISNYMAMLIRQKTHWRVEVPKA